MIGWLLLALLALLILAVALQLMIPRIAARRVAAHLTTDGGEAEVALRAVPALRLLWRQGDRIEVRGRSLQIAMSSGSGEGGGGLSTLDGFSEVELALYDFATGPFEVSGFELRRNGAGPYRMRSEAMTSAAALLGYGGSQLGLAGVLTTLVRQAPLGDRSFPVAIEVELASEEGALRIVSGGGTIAGYPAGPVAGLIAAAVANRLELP